MTTPKNLMIFDTYIGAGKWLMDKDRNVNSDLVEIYEFFKPIDRLFGDYETRSKYHLQEILYRKNLKNVEIAISKKEIEKKGKLKGDDRALLVFFVFFKQGEYFIEYTWTDIKAIISRRPIPKVIPVDTYFLMRCILDPEKLYQIIHLDPARFDYSCKKFWEKNAGLLKKGVKTSTLNNFIEAYAFVKNFFKRHGRHFEIHDNQKIEIANLRPIEDKHIDYLLEKSDSIELINEKIKDLQNDDIINAQEIIDALEKEKLKNFERFNEVRIRLGLYEDGRYVVFMHPYESEAHCPGRIPSE